MVRVILTGPPLLHTCRFSWPPEVDRKVLLPLYMGIPEAMVSSAFSVSVGTHGCS